MNNFRLLSSLNEVELQSVYRNNTFVQEKLEKYLFKTENENITDRILEEFEENSYSLIFGDSFFADLKFSDDYDISYFQSRFKELNDDYYLGTHCADYDFIFNSEDENEIKNKISQYILSLLNEEFQQILDDVEYEGIIVDLFIDEYAKILIENKYVKFVVDDNFHLYAIINADENITEISKIGEI